MRSQTDGTTRPWIVALVAGLVGGLAAALLTALARSEASQPTEIAGLDAIERQLQQLTAELRERPVEPTTLPQRLDTANVPRDAPVEPLQPSATAELEAAAARLEAMLGRLETAATTDSRPLTIPDPAFTQPARETLLQAKKSDSLPDELYLANYQQVLDRYGRPSIITAINIGTVRWGYFDPVDSNRRRYLVFADGHVIDWAWQ
jgi:hypothetical protein